MNTLKMKNKFITLLETHELTFYSISTRNTIALKLRIKFN